MDNSAFLGTGNDFAKILDLIENFHPFGTFCSENEDLDTLLDNSLRCTDHNGA